MWLNVIDVFPLNRKIPEKAKRLIPTIKGKKVACSYLSFKLWMEGKYDTELIYVENFKKVLVFLVAKILKDITNYSLKLAKVVSQ